VSFSFSLCNDDCAPALGAWEDGEGTHRVSLSDIFASLWLGCYHQAGCVVNVASGRGGVGGGKRGGSTRFVNLKFCRPMNEQCGAFG
jgi:hypothetical protein